VVKEQDDGSMDYTPSPSYPSSHGGERFLHTGMKQRVLYNVPARERAWPSIRRSMLALGNHGDADDLRWTGKSWWRDNLFDLISAFALCRISEGLLAALRCAEGRTSTSLALCFDWCCWLVTTFNTSNHVNAFNNRFDVDSLPDFAIA